MNEVAKDFAKILKTKKELEKMVLSNQTGNEFHDQYYALENKLKEMLRFFLMTDFTLLSKGKFLQLCDLVSTHRPVAPFSFLVSISIRKKGK